MNILDILHAPWAISPHKLGEIQAIYATHLRGDKIDIEAIEKRLGRPLDNSPKGYEVRDGVALIALDGVLAKRANLFSQISGGTSTQLAGRDIRAAAADPDVKAIILAIDSPGGTVDGTQTLASEIAAAGASKPIVSWASGLMASAAYWAGSAAQGIYIADMTTQVGSIGVVAQHVDTSAADKAAGVTKTDVYAGKFKRIATGNAPLSEDGAAYLQAQVDYMYSLMVGDIAANLGVSVEQVLQDMADGRVFMGQQAIDAGLVDGVSTLDALVAKLSGGAGVALPRKSSAGNAQTSQSTQGALNMLTAEQVQAALKDHPEIAAAIRTEGATAERDRILGIQALSIPGHEALIKTFAGDATKTAGDAALALVAATQKTLTAQAAALAEDAKGAGGVLPGAAPAPAPAADAKGPLTRDELHKKATALAAEKGIDYVAAVRQLEATQGA